MALDPLVVLCPSLQEYFVDKDTGGPLSGGIVTFYHDNSRSVMKPVYQLNQNGPYSDASYIQLKNPIILSAVGTFADDNGNDIVPYLFPYEGIPGSTNQVLDLYYITVNSSAGVFQFSRSAWPNTTSEISPINSNEIVNYIPNGQFLLHNNSPVVGSNITVPAQGGSSADISYIAQGGWSFQVPHATESTNSISFVEIPPQDDPDVTADTRFVIDVQCTAPSTPDTFKDLCIQFPDVNKFGSASTVNNYTFSFQAISLTGNPIAVQIRLMKFFGTGGSPSTSTDAAFGAGSVTIAPDSLFSNAEIYTVSGLFGNNSGQTLGTNNDDYLQIAIRFPNVISNVQLSNFILTNGVVAIQGFPQTTNSQFIAPSTAGWLPTPNPDGSDMYLPVKLGPEGLIYDSSEIGDVVQKLSTSFFTNSISTISNELLINGAQYKTGAYSPLGIPYYRLQQKIFDVTSGCPLFGTGSAWINTYISGGLNTQLILATNQISVPQTVPADSAGATATGFTFVSNHNPAVASNYGFDGYSNSTGFVTAISDFSTGTHSANGAVDFNTGMTITNYVQSTVTNAYFAFTAQSIAASSLANTGGAGKYFTFSNNTTDYYFWFFVSNETDPAAAGRTGIKCQLTSTMTIADVGAVIAATLNAYQTNFITVTGQPTGGASSYFTFHSNNVQTAVWYQINGLGVAPAIASSVMVSLTGSESAAQVAQKTQVAINSTYFALPNFQGLTLRGQDTTGIWDIDVATRFSSNSMLVSTSLGSLELGQLLSHSHSPGTLLITPRTAGGTATSLVTDQSGSGVLGGTDSGNTVQVTVNLPLTGNTALYGGTENRTVNAYVAYAIKY